MNFPMPTIELTTKIKAPVRRCFDLARSIDLHKLSTEGTDEEAIAGVTTGLISAGEQVTWRAKHFGITQKLTSKITAFQYPYHFRDEMLEGAFKMIIHDHIFEESDGVTIMKDKLEFESPGGLLGVIFNKLILEKYLRSLLVTRNRMIKDVAEGDRWKTILNR
jgi:ligand-binding SRPBCC domain-containing protein